MSLSQIACSIHPSPTVALNEEARLLRDKGEPIIHLGVGEPKNRTPIAAILSSAAKLNSGEVKYEPTDGTPSLKKAVIRYTEETMNARPRRKTSSSPMVPSSRSGTFYSQF